MKKETNKLNLIFILTYMGDALFSPFLALYFSSINFDDYNKGILLALFPLSTLIGSLIYGKLSTNSKRNLLIIRVLVILNLIPMVFMGFVKNYILVAVFTIIFALHNNPLFSFSDGMAVKITTQENRLYANTRIFGTIGYLIGSLLGGYLIDLTSFGIVFLIAGSIYAFAELLFFFLKPGEDEVYKKQDITFKQVLSNKNFIIYLVFYILVMGTWNIEEAYVPLLFESQGITPSEWGYIYAWEILMEVIGVFLINRLLVKRLKPNVLLLTGISLILVRTLFLSLDLSTWSQVAITSTLRGIAWSFFLCSHIEMVKLILPNHLVTKAVLVFAICSNIYVALGNYVAPYIFSSYSYSLLYFILLMIQLVGFIVLIIGNLIHLRKIHNLKNDQL